MRRVLSLAFVMALAMPAVTRADDWQSLFNGKDLTGWKGKSDLWSVKDGAIVGYTKDGKIEGGNSFLVWDGTVADFELKVQFKIVGGNSGIQYRSKYAGKAEEHRIGGYQADIDGSKGMGFYGILYEERGRGVLTNRGTKTYISADGVRHEQRVADAAEILKAVKPTDWNEYEIHAKANHLIHKVNGVVTAETIDFQKDKRAMEGLLAIQIHAGMGEMWIHVKDVKLKKITDAKELTPENTPIPAEAKAVNPPKKATPKKTDKK